VGAGAPEHRHAGDRVERECIGRRLAEPCSHLEKLARPGLLRPLVHRGGLRADILEGGQISIGDSVAVAE
jgi:hypothetical protein